MANTNSNLETDSLLMKNDKIKSKKNTRDDETQLSEFLDNTKWKKTHTLHMLFAGMIWFSQGVLITVDSLSFSAIQKVFKLKDVQLGYYNAALAIGILIGCLPTSMADSIGRRRVFLMYIFAESLFGCLQGFCVTYGQLLLLRIFLGMSAAGVWLLTPTIIAESLPKKNRGFYLLLYCALWPVGAAVSVLIAKLTLPSWKLTLSFSGIPTLVMAILAYCYLPESPRYYIVKGEWGKVKKHIMRNLWNKTNDERNVDAPVDNEVEILNNIPNNKNENDYIVEKKIEDGEDSNNTYLSPSTLSSNKYYNNNNNNANTCSKIWNESIGLLIRRPDQYKAIFAVTMTWFFVSGASWGLSTWLPTIIERKDKKLGMDPFRIILFNSICDCFSIVVSAFIIDHLGRKPMIKFGFFFGGIFAFLLSFAKNEAIAMMCSGLHQMSQAIIWIVLAAFTSESFGTQLRSSVYAFANAIARISMILSTIITGIYITKDVNAPLYIVSCLYVSGFLISFTLPPETKGLALKNY